jgi:hypothetical protein
MATLSAGIQCADCGLWPMPDPFNAIIDSETGEIEKYVCNKCGENYKSEDSDG